MGESKVKTLVRARHKAGPLENGGDGCHARWGHGGMCPGVATAAWLNSLGNDNEIFTARYTNGQVRENWLRDSGHIERVPNA